MKFFITAIASISFVCNAVANPVVGQATGFAAGTTGGGNLAPITPSNEAELKSLLEDAYPRVITIDREYNFIGTEGRVTAQGCRPASNTCSGRGQDAINQANWCTDGLSASTERITVNYDQAAINGILVASNKSLVGLGANAVIRGKGLRIANGATNVVVQNIHITELNPQYIWGGDALTLAGTDLIWVDHMKFSLIGRQMFVAGYAASNRVTISNSEFDGITPWSASCDGRHYWTMLLLGSNDQITLEGNYIHHTSGRGPKIGGNTLVHAVNNYWYSISGHAFDIENEPGQIGAKVLAEGNVFEEVVTPLRETSTPGQLFAAPNSVSIKSCRGFIGRQCRENALKTSGSFEGSSIPPVSDMAGKNVVDVSTTGAVDKGVKYSAGVGKLGN